MIQEQYPGFRFSIRTVLAITCLAAIFFSGYCLGIKHERDEKFNRITELISATIQPN